MDIKKVAKHLPYLGGGAFRSVYALSEKEVLKVNHSDQDGFYGSCGNEVASYEHLRKTPAKDFIAPVLDHGAGWLIMARAVMNRCTERERDLLKSVLGPLGVRDLHGGNVGKLDGRPVATDYGHSRVVPVAAAVPIVRVRPVIPMAGKVFDQEACEDCGETNCRCDQMSFLPSWVKGMR